jgi:hypothetical protein
MAEELVELGRPYGRMAARAAAAGAFETVGKLGGAVLLGTAIYAGTQMASQAENPMADRVVGGAIGLGALYAGLKLFDIV